jgi:RNA polymerase nonessential primary-like sigma factor
MDQTRTIRLPIHIVKEMNTFLKAQRLLAQTMDHDPTAQEIADYMEELAKPIKAIRISSQNGQKRKITCPK